MTQLIQLMKPGIPQGALDDKAKCDVLSRIFSENNVDREGSDLSAYVSFDSSCLRYQIDRYI